MSSNRPGGSPPRAGRAYVRPPGLAGGTTIDLQSKTNCEYGPMTSTGLDIVILGLSITSSWGNGHATTFRALVRELSALGHNVLFIERDLPWYADNRDMRTLPWGHVELYRSLTELRSRFQRRIANADAVIVGSYVPEGIKVGQWVSRIARGV